MRRTTSGVISARETGTGSAGRRAAFHNRAMRSSFPPVDSRGSTPYRAAVARSAAAPPQHPGPHGRRPGLHRHRGLRRRDPDPEPGHAGRVGAAVHELLHRRHLLPDPRDAALRGGPPPGRARGHGEPDGGRPPGPDRLRGVPERARPPPAGGAAGRGVPHFDRREVAPRPGGGPESPDPRIRPLLRPPHGGGQPLRGRRARGHPRRHSLPARRRDRSRASGGLLFDPRLHRRTDRLPPGGEGSGENRSSPSGPTPRRTGRSRFPTSSSTSTPAPTTAAGRNWPDGASPGRSGPA